MTNSTITLTSSPAIVTTPNGTITVEGSPVLQTADIVSGGDLGSALIVGHATSTKWFPMSVWYGNSVYIPWPDWLIGAGEDPAGIFRRPTPVPSNTNFMAMPINVHTISMSITVETTMDLSLYALAFEVTFTSGHELINFIRVPMVFTNNSGGVTTLPNIVTAASGPIYVQGTLTEQLGTGTYPVYAKFSHTSPDTTDTLRVRDITYVIESMV